MLEKELLCIMVDDDLDDQEIFRMAVQQTGKKVKLLTANDGTKGLELLADPELEPDFIFLDLNMHEMGGKECLAEIRKSPRFRNVPVIIYSTSSYIEDIRETRRLGASGFVTKPTDIQELIDVLKQIFEGRYSLFRSAYYQ